MASPQYIDSDYVGAILTDARRDSLVGTAAHLTTMIESATAKVRAAILHAGYVPPTQAQLATSALENSAPLIRSATFGALVSMLHGRRGQAVRREFADDVGIWRALASGTLPLEDLAPVAKDAIGGGDMKSASSENPRIAPRLRDLGDSW